MAKFAGATQANHRVTPLELFFDLVFVFALTQVTGYLAIHLSPTGFAEGIVLLALIWWAWVAYAWFGTAVRLDEGLVRLLLFAAMGAVLVVAVGLPEAFADRPGGFDGILSAPTIVVAAYASVRLLHLALFAVVGRGDPGVAGAVARFGLPVLVSLALLGLGSLLPPGPRLATFALAVLIDYAGAVIGGGRGWRVSAGHFAERHGLIIIIALGESIVSIGVGVADLPLSWPVVITANLGLAIAACLWWLYFDVTADAAEHRLASLEGAARNRAARDGYSFGHLFMVAGIVLMALGLKKVSLAVAESGELLGGHLKALVVLALCTGLAGYLLAHVYFRWRMTGGWAGPRIAAAGVALALTPIGLVVAPSVLLALVLLLLLATVLLEARMAAPPGSAMALGTADDRLQ